eukprot:5868839-Alexandrium_andersonii.AAC.1
MSPCSHTLWHKLWHARVSANISCGSHVLLDSSLCVTARQSKCGTESAAANTKVGIHRCFGPVQKCRSAANA